MSCRRVVVFGNSGSGKSTLSRRLAETLGLAHLDLDEIAWKPNQPGVREGMSVSVAHLKSFVAANKGWVIEGCYSGLISASLEHADELIFLNPGIDACLQNCRNRPWEKHKYPSKEAQDKNLEMLLNWVSEYESREDEFSLQAHLQVFESFQGRKTELSSSEEADRKFPDLAME